MKTSRYPGVAPFESHQSYIFAGRDRDTQDLYKLILLEKQILLYSKSGVGKSSLVNAGVLPLLQQDANFETLRIRFFAHTKDTPTPVKTVQEQLKANGFDRKSQSAQEIADLAAPQKESLWKYFKTLQLAELETGAAKTFLLIFDQFEELFSYPEDEVLEFKSQLADVLQGDLPQDCVDDVAQARKSRPELFSRSIIAQLHKSLNVKVLFIIRSDRLHLLNALTDYLPNIQQTYYELKPLNAKQAGDAINEPAKIAQAEGHFISPAYKVSNAALLRIMRDLTDKFENDVETTQLQIVCQKLESIAMEKQQANNLPEAFELTPGDLPDFKGIFLKFYEDTIAKLPANQQTAARLLIEDGLIRNKQRISLDKSICTDDYRLAETTLNQLVEHHLLRSEQNTTKGYNYELAHDTLVAPIQDAADKRHEAEEKERQLKIKNEELRIEREKQKKQRRTFAFVLALALLFLGIGIFGIVMWKRAERQTAIADRQTTEAKKQTAIASRQTAEAQKQKGIANDKAAKLALEQKKLEKALTEAKASKNTAEVKSIEAQLAKNIADQQKQNAIALLKQELESTGIKVDNLFDYYAKKANTEYAKGKYTEAINDYNRAKLMSENKNEQAAILPLYTKLTKILNLLKEAGQLNGKHNYASAIEKYKEILHTNPTDSISQFRLEIAVMLKDGYMVKIPAGSFMMGGEDDRAKPIHKVKLDQFSIAKYELTQYIYQKVVGFNPSYYIEDLQNPVEEVDWYDCVEFCNLLSELMGLKPCYQIDKIVRDKNNKSNHQKMYSIALSNESNGFRLPTEAEWEYAAGGGKKGVMQQYAGTDSVNELKNYAWYDDNSERKTHSVGGKRANLWGLYDMTGNVWEWCWDWYADYAEGSVTNPQGAIRGSSRVLRGGSWIDGAAYGRVASRFNSAPGRRFDYYGFRLVFVP